MGLAGVVFVVLLILKLVGVITCSWWIVTLPLWIGIALWFVFAFGIILVAMAASFFSRGS